MTRELPDLLGSKLQFVYARALCNTYTVATEMNIFKRMLVVRRHAFEFLRIMTVHVTVVEVSY